MDIALVLDPLQLSADILVEKGGLRMDGGLTTAVMISLFTDRRADPDDPVDDRSPAGARGWPGDLLEPPGQRYGSRLWLLTRAKMQEAGQETAALVQQYAAEALQWLIDDGVADTVDVTATRAGLEAIGMTVAVSRGGKSLGRWDFVWNAQAAS